MMRWIALLLVCASPALASDIEGQIALKGAQEAYHLWIGCLYKTPSGRIEDSGIGSTIVRDGPPVWVTNRYYRPRVTALAWNPKTGCRFRHGNLRAGRYLVYVRSGPFYYDWRWVQVRGGKERVRIDLTVDPARAGTLEVRLQNMEETTRVSFLPLDAAGRVAFFDPNAAFTRLSSTESVDGKALFEGLRAGRYRVTAGNVQREVTIKAGETTSVTLQPER